MKILMLTPYLPYPLLSGGQIRTYNLLKNLSQKHQVTLFSLIKDDSEKQYLNELKKFCVKVRVFKRTSSPWTIRNILMAGFTPFPFLVTRNLVKETKAAVEDEIKTTQYDLIHAETFYMMPNIPKTQIPVILVEQTIEYLGYLSYASKNKYFPIKPFLYVDITKIKFWEKHYWQSCTRLITMSEDDKNFIRSVASGVKNINVVANGVDAKWFSQIKKSLPPDPTVLFIGTFKWLPNVEAVEFLVEEIWPLIKSEIPTAKLWIVGNSPTDKVYHYEKTDGSIKVTGGIPDIRNAFAKAHVLLAPVLSGKGTRFKILEAMASGTPAVGTPIALEGLGITPGKEAVVANSAQDLATSTIKILKDKQIQAKLSQNGKAFVSKKYDWKSISQVLDRIYQEVGQK